MGADYPPVQNYPLTQRKDLREPLPENAAVGTVSASVAQDHVVTPPLNVLAHAGRSEQVTLKSAQRFFSIRFVDHFNSLMRIQSFILVLCESQMLFWVKINK